MKNKLLLIVTLICCILLIGCNNQKSENNTNSSEYEYEIEEAFPDDTFKSIIEGEIIPVEIRLGIGGEGGYEQYSTKDAEMINEYIEAFKMVKIEQIITNKEDMITVSDGIEDYSFIMEDGTVIVLGTDLSKYVIDRESGKEFVLEYNEKLHDLNRRIQGN